MTLSSLAIAGTVILFYRRRIAQLQRANAAQEAFSRRLIESQEGERKRIAAELHDGLGQSLAIIKNRALLSLGAPDDHERALEQLDEIATAATCAIDEAKEIAYNLRPYHLDRLGLTKALGAMIRNMSESHRIAFETEIDDLDGVFSKESEINLYRIIQESVNNIVKHADATEAQIVIRKNARSVGITIHDDGKGFAIDSPNSHDRAKGGFGLIGIAERARMLGGSPEIDSAPGKGTTITMELDFSETRKGKRHGH